MTYTREELNRMSRWELIELVENLLAKDAEANSIRIKLIAIKNIIKGEAMA